MLLLLMVMELLLIVVMRRIGVLVLLLLRTRPDVHLAVLDRCRAGARAAAPAAARSDQIRFATVLRLVPSAQAEPVVSL